MVLCFDWSPVSPKNLAGPSPFSLPDWHNTHTAKSFSQRNKVGRTEILSQLINNMDSRTSSKDDELGQRRSSSPERGRSREARRRSDRSESSRSSSSSRSRHKHRKKHSSRDGKKKKRRRSYSSSSDSSSSTDSRRRRKDRKKHKKRSKSKKRRSDKKKSHKKESRKKSRHSDDSSSSDGEDGPDVKRSVITGKKIKMHIDKTNDDLVREKARKDLLKFMNQSL
jgi:hypothetical protein